MAELRPLSEITDEQSLFLLKIPALRDLLIAGYNEAGEPLYEVKESRLGILAEAGLAYTPHLGSSVGAGIGAAKQTPDDIVSGINKRGGVNLKGETPITKVNVPSTEQGVSSASKTVIKEFPHTKLEQGVVRYTEETAKKAVNPIATQMENKASRAVVKETKGKITFKEAKEMFRGMFDDLAQLGDNMASTEKVKKGLKIGGIVGGFLTLGYLGYSFAKGLIETDLMLDWGIVDTMQTTRNFAFKEIADKVEAGDMTAAEGMALMEEYDQSTDIVDAYWTESMEKNPANKYIYGDTWQAIKNVQDLAAESHVQRVVDAAKAEEAIAEFENSQNMSMSDEERALLRQDLPEDYRKDLSAMQYSGTGEGHGQGGFVRDQKPIDTDPVKKGKGPSARPRGSRKPEPKKPQTGFGLL